MYDGDCRFTHCAALHRRTNSNRRDAVRRQQARDRLRHAGAARLVVVLAVAPERERVEDSVGREAVVVRAEQHAPVRRREQLEERRRLGRELAERGDAADQLYKDDRLSGDHT